MLLYGLSTSQFKSSPVWEHVKLLMTCTNKQGPCSPLSLTQVAPLSEEQKFAPHQLPAWQKLALAQDREPVPKESLSQVSGLQLVTKTCLPGPASPGLGHG